MTQGDSRTDSRKSKKRKAAGSATDPWYTDAADYWARIPATVDGVLGGFGELSDPDARGNAEFIREFVEPKRGEDGEVVQAARMGTDVVCDCGAGIGRVSRTFLLHVFRHVDLVEQEPRFLETARTQHLREFVDPADPEKPRVDRWICKGLQEFEPEVRRYDAVWAQWVLGHLKDDDLVSFFRRCIPSLKPGGLIFVKENLTGEPDRSDVDEEDSSVTRSEEMLKGIFARAGLVILKEEVQKGFPKGMYAVKTWALSPEGR